MMEIRYTHTQPGTFIARPTIYQDYSRTKCHGLAPIGQRMVNYSPPLLEPSKWKKSTGGLTGINSPFSETRCAIRSSTHEIAPPNEAHKYQTNPKKVVGFRPTVVASPAVGPTKYSWKHNYYKELLAEEREMRNSMPHGIFERLSFQDPNNENEASRKKIRNGHYYPCEENEPIRKRSRSDTGYDVDGMKGSAFTIATKQKKCNISHSTIHDRLKTLPPPPPLVKVNKLNQQKIRRTQDQTKDARFTVQTHCSTEEPRHTSMRCDSESTLRSCSCKTHSPRLCPMLKEGDHIKKNRGIEKCQLRKPPFIPEQSSIRREKRLSVPIISSSSLTACDSQESRRPFSVPDNRSPRSQGADRCQHRNVTDIQGNTVLLDNQSPTKQQKIRSASGGINTSPRSSDVYSTVVRPSIQVTPVNDGYQKPQQIYESNSTARSPVTKHQKSKENQEILPGFDEKRSIHTTRNNTKAPRTLETADGGIILITDHRPTSAFHETTSRSSMNSRMSWRSNSFESDKTLHGPVRYLNSRETPTDEYLLRMGYCLCTICRDAHLAKKSQAPYAPSAQSLPPLSLKTSSALETDGLTQYNSIIPLYNGFNRKLHRSYSSNDVPHSLQSLLCKNSAAFAAQRLNSVKISVQDPARETQQSQITQSRKISTDSMPETLKSDMEDTEIFPLKQPLRPILPKMSPPKSEKNIQYDKNKNEIRPQKSPPSCATKSQEITSPVGNTQSKPLVKRNLSECHASRDQNSSNEMLLKLPVEEDKEESYGGFAYDHDSLPIIVAVHSVGVQDQNPNNDDKALSITETNPSDVSLDNSPEVPKPCQSLTQTKISERFSTSSVTKRSCDAETKETTNKDSLHPNNESLVDWKSHNEDNPEPIVHQIYPHGKDFREAASDGQDLTIPKTKSSAKDLASASNKAKIPNNIHTVCGKPHKREVTVESLSKKIKETRQRIEDENIEWKKKLLFRLEYVLTKRLRKAEILTGVKSTLEFPSQKEKPKPSLQKNMTTKEGKHDEKANVSVQDAPNQRSTKNSKQTIRKRHKLKKLVLSSSQNDDSSSDCELSIEETQKLQETNSEEIDIMTN